MNAIHDSQETNRFGMSLVSHAERYVAEKATCGILRFTCIALVVLSIPFIATAETKHPLETCSREEIQQQLFSITPPIDFCVNPNADEFEIEIGVSDRATLISALHILGNTSEPVVLRIVSSVPLSGDECRAVADISWLDELDLHRCGISDDGLSHILNTTNIRSLIMPRHLSDTQLKAIKSWPPRLGGLDSSGNALPDESWKALSHANRLAVVDVVSDASPTELSSTAWETLRGLPCLQCLRINATTEDISQLESLPGLTTIILVGDDQHRFCVGSKSAKVLGKLAQCESLYFWAANITPDVLQELGRMKSLRELKLDNCIVEQSEQSKFNCLKQLRSLELPYTNVTPSGLRSIGELNELEFLSLIASGADDAGTKHLAKMQNLSALYLSQCQVTDQGIVQVASLPKLKTLELQSTLVSDKGLKYIASEGRIQNLGLRSTRITSQGITRLSLLPKLRLLDLSEVNVDAVALKSFAHAQSLTRLYLADCNLDDRSLRDVEQIPHLESLDISNNPGITSSAVNRLTRHPRLVAVSIENCALEGANERVLNGYLNVVDSQSVNVAKTAPDDSISK